MLQQGPHATVSVLVAVVLDATVAVAVALEMAVALAMAVAKALAVAEVLAVAVPVGEILAAAVVVAVQGLTGPAPQSLPSHLPPSSLSNPAPKAQLTRQLLLLLQHLLLRAWAPLLGPLTAEQCEWRMHTVTA